MKNAKNAPTTASGKAANRKTDRRHERAPYAATWQWTGARFEGMTDRERAALFGRATEVRFTLDALRRGYSVCRPYGNQPGWDCAVEHRGRFFRVQVKATHWLRDPAEKLADRALVSWAVSAQGGFDVLAIWIEEKGQWILLAESEVPPTGVAVRECSRYYAGLEDWGLFERLAKARRPRNKRTKGGKDER